MRKILFFSDSHSNTDEMIEIIQQTKEVDAIIHAGDHARDAETLEAIFTHIPVYYVSGNCDFHSSYAPDERLVEIFGKRFLIAHGHQYNVKNEVYSNYLTISQSGEQKCADVVVFGHTHIPYVGLYNTMHVVNPGSVKYSRTYSVCEIDGDKINIRNCKL